MKHSFTQSPLQAAKDDHFIAKHWDEQEQCRIDEMSSQPVLNHAPARKSKSKLNRLLKTLDSIQQGGTR
ncbi:MAG: hypothetical protein HC845_15435 [Akkermansiaceae bacterium]|nr:hypothetical protein [Akkermansiaceae bacterium]NJR42409.1 hypothetical protein [Akkermansiaceae bacterium]